MICTGKLIKNKQANDFIKLVMDSAKRRKSEIVNAVKNLPGFKKEFVLNNSAGVYATHADAWAEGWAQSDLQDGRPPKPLYVVMVPYGNTPSLLLFTEDPQSAMEEMFPETVVSVTMES